MGLMELLIGKTPEVLKGVNGLTLSREDIARFGDVVRDESPIHRDLDIAKEYGFEDTPVIGVHVAAHGGRVSRDLLEAIQTPDNPLYFANQSIVFRGPVYPGEPINWIKTKEQETEDGVSYELVVPSKQEGKKPRVVQTTVFTKDLPMFKERDSDSLVYRSKASFTPKNTKQFYECLREEPLRAVPFSLGVAQTPSALLEFVKVLNEMEKKEVGGKNLEMHSTLYQPLEIGDAQIDIYLVDKKERPRGSIYTFDGVVSQNDEPRISTRVRTMTNESINVEKLKPIYKS